MSTSKERTITRIEISVSDRKAKVTARPAMIPAGSWPRRMSAELAAGYCGEPSVEAFMKRWRRVLYPAPCINEGRRKLWLKDDLDRIIVSDASEVVPDVAADL
jgi:hypothetical protein